jgi:hypothetical protein
VALLRVGRARAIRDDLGVALQDLVEIVEARARLFNLDSLKSFE